MVNPIRRVPWVKQDVSHLRALGALCAIVELKDRLRKLGDRATMCFFVGYKYDRGGCRVWDPKRRVVVESRDIGFFEDDLPSPTLNDLPPRPVDEGEPVTQPVLDHSIKPTMQPDAANAPALSPRTAPTSTALHHRHLICASPYACLGAG